MVVGAASKRNSGQGWGGQVALGKTNKQNVRRKLLVRARDAFEKERLWCNLELSVFVKCCGVRRLLGLISQRLSGKCLVRS